MKLTEYEKEVITRALDNYIVMLSSKEDTKTEYEIKTAKEIRAACQAIKEPKTTQELIDAINYAHKHAHDSPVFIGPGFFPFKTDAKDM
jgi:hypothetical protein